MHEIKVTRRILTFQHLNSLGSNFQHGISESTPAVVYFIVSTAPYPLPSSSSTNLQAASRNPQHQAYSTCDLCINPPPDTLQRRHNRLIILYHRRANHISGYHDHQNGQYGTYPHGSSTPKKSERISLHHCICHNQPPPRCHEGFCTHH